MAPDSVIERPSSVPQPGVIEPFDAGWNAHEAGLERSTVEVLTVGNYGHSTRRDWALLAWDVRDKLARAKVEE